MQLICGCPLCWRCWLRVEPVALTWLAVWHYRILSGSQFSHTGPFSCIKGCSLSHRYDQSNLVYKEMNSQQRTRSLHVYLPTNRWLKDSIFVSNPSLDQTLFSGRRDARPHSLHCILDLVHLSTNLASCSGLRSLLSRFSRALFSIPGISLPCNLSLYLAHMGLS